MTAEKSAARRFYGRRFGRALRAGRRRLLNELLPTLQITFADGALDPANLFQKPPKECCLEIGFGGGEHLAAQAAAHPDSGFIGCEPFVNGVARLLSEIDAKRLRNIRIYPDDARDLIDGLPSDCLDRVFLLFPDPWPKSRHAARRFISAENLDSLARVMRDEGEFRFASDEMEYVRWTLQHVLAHPAFEWIATAARDWRERPADWSPTRYEQKALSDDRPCVYLRFRRHKRP